MQRPLDNARIEVAREVCEWTILMTGQGCHCKRRLLRMKYLLVLSDVPDHLQGVIAASHEHPGYLRVPVDRSHSILMK